MKFILLGIAALLPGIAPAGESSWSLQSPDRSCVISVTLNDPGELSYEVFHHGRPALVKSPLGLRREDQAFDCGLVLQNSGSVQSSREAYQLFAGVTPRVDHTLNRRSLSFRTASNAQIILDLAASNEGVAFRYRFAEESREVRTLSVELTGFHVPLTARGWLQPYHAAGPYTPAYEDFYFNVAAGERPPDSRAKAVGWAFPALFQIPDAHTWVLLTEAGTDASYCGCHLSPDCSGGVYRIDFPLADETTKGHTNKFGPEPRSSLPWTMPWRVMILGSSAGDIATSTLVTDLCAPSRITDASWITPGRAAWAWWSYPDGPATAERFNEFTDFAAKMGWEYTLFDAGWWTPGLDGIAAHAVSKGVIPLAWLFAADFYDSKNCTTKLDQMVAAGIRGVKVDFWCSDYQEAMAAQLMLMREAAARHMIVNLHGCTIPRGWQRTWPNLLSTEAVLGDECYFFEPLYTDEAAALNTILPFTRNVVGPMDVTPVACSPKKFARKTTAAHELAAAIIFTSGLIHYADNPQFFESLPPAALQVFRDAPARWDETRCLAGEPGREAIFARRAGKNWFIAGINGTTNALPVSLDLAPYKAYRRRILIAEGTDPKMQVIATVLKNSTQWQHTIPPRGGFLLRLDK